MVRTLEEVVRELGVGVELGRAEDGGGGDAGALQEGGQVVAVEAGAPGFEGGVDLTVVGEARFELVEPGIGEGGERGDGKGRFCHCCAVSQRWRRNARRLGSDRRRGGWRRAIRGRREERGDRSR
ncbi:hypothetical protein [Candidatus Amarobacter glycogenicus]|uniref:hypothetical protein n=1 Tax=Candidatus Amarobacter glycogenicus TaxID=3140699 RepID=UPI0031CC8204